MKTYSVQIRQYLCHPETCAHDEHLPFWIVESKPWPSGYGFPGTNDRWVKGFETRREAEEALNG